MPGLASRYWSQRRTLLRALQERNAQLLRERQMIAGQARMRERQRIAQDMHDSLGHQLALIAVHTGALEVDRELTGRQREAVGVLREASVAAMHELREVVGILKDGGAQEEPAAQAASRVVAGIEALVESAAAAGTPVLLERCGEPRPLAPAADHAAYRIAQEGLTNAYKHAPGAPITVSLRYEPDSLVVEVANGPVPGEAGPWPGAVSGGQGLMGLRERARLVGGMVHAGPVDAGGFRLAGVLPYETGEARETTFGDATDDFRQQTGAEAPGDGGPVIDWSDPREEFKNIMGSTRRNHGCLIGCGAGVLILAGLVVALVFGAGKLLDEVDKAMIDPSVYASVHVGDPEDRVREKLPSGKSFFTIDAKRQAPPEPPGAGCITGPLSVAPSAAPGLLFRPGTSAHPAPRALRRAPEPGRGPAPHPARHSRWRGGGAGKHTGVLRARLREREPGGKGVPCQISVSNPHRTDLDCRSSPPPWNPRSATSRAPARSRARPSSSSASARLPPRARNC
ncbi:sensor histidine kinase [Streptomyces syringium]|uniref:sensor histidine kinase n=1 Tax=Streptomyces syringium TaxID=76729 RepID=UPI003D8AAE86